jgi:hypothetical protein
MPFNLKFTSGSEVTFVLSELDAIIKTISKFKSTPG